MAITTVHGGAGVVDVRGGPAALLYLDGEPAALDGDDCAGSIGRLWARAKTTPPRPEALAALEDLTTVGCSPNGLAADLRPVLDLFADGEYELRGPEPITTPIGASDVDPLDRWYVADAAPGVFGWTYPYSDDYLVPTQEWPVHDQVAVARYRKLIKHGHRPVVLALRTAESDCSGFVLDGHHKLAAYEELGIAPTVVRIARLDAPRLTEDEVRTYFPGSDTQYLLRTLAGPRG